jgi:hypothetical protein
MPEFEKQVLDADRVIGFINTAIGSHGESAQLRTAIDLGAMPALREADDGDRIELHLVRDDQPESLLVADIPADDLMPSQN